MYANQEEDFLQGNGQFLFSEKSIRLGNVFNYLKLKLLPFTCNKDNFKIYF